MNDENTRIADLKAAQRAFVDARDWSQFHTPKNLAMACAIEASELMELFLWVSEQGPAQRPEPSPERIREEVADIALCLLNFCNATGIDLASAIEMKMAKNALKYPAEAVRGRAEKYDEIRRSKD